MFLHLLLSVFRTFSLKFVSVNVLTHPCTAFCSPTTSIYKFTCVPYGEAPGRTNRPCCVGALGKDLGRDRRAAFSRGIPEDPNAYSSKHANPKCLPIGYIPQNKPYKEKDKAQNAMIEVS